MLSHQDIQRLIDQAPPSARLELDFAGVGKARPRVISTGKKSWAFMPRQYREYIAAVRHAAARAGFDAQRIADSAGPECCAIMLFGVPMPRTLSAAWMRRAGLDASRKSQQERRRLAAGAPCRIKPDLDNLEGGLLDALLERDEVINLIASAKVWHDGAGFCRLAIVNSPSRKRQQARFQRAQM